MRSLRGWLGLSLAIAVLCVWQASFWHAGPRLDKDYHVTASVGLCDDIREFFFLHYYLNEFPIAIRGGPPVPNPFTSITAERFVTDHGRYLVMDLGDPCNTRHGDMGKLFLYWPKALWQGNPAAPSPRPFITVLFVGSLAALFTTFWWRGYPLLGALLVLFVGSDPFQLLQVYGQWDGENVFSLPISVTLLVLSLNVRFLTTPANVRRPAWLTAAFTGALLASFREVRSEAVLIGVALPFVYLSVSARVRDRIILVLVFMLAYTLTATAWTMYFDRSYRSAEEFVRHAGGHPYTGPHLQHHPVWHSMFMGIADFDSTHGYRWDDRSAYAYAVPILRERYGLQFTYDVAAIERGEPSQPSHYYFHETYDEQGLYRVSPIDLPQYTEIVRTKLLSDIFGDPAWYLDILRKRWRVVMQQTTPLSIAIGESRFGVPLSGWLSLPTLVILVLMRRWFLAKLILMTFPLSLTALLVFSGLGTPYYNIFHIVTACVWVQLLAEVVRERRRRAMLNRDTGGTC